MTRPNIVRADTLDLQDQDNPTAAEHQKPITHGGLAAHQRAEIHHVLEERHSEEHALADAWNMSEDLTEEPGMIDHSQSEHAELGQTTNGTHANGEEGGENGEADGDLDDDMMDRISSSPSIDDGGYTLQSPLTPLRHNPAMARVKWPLRTSSLSPSPRSTPTPTRERTSNKSASLTPDSSPFLQAPQHLSLRVRTAGRESSPLMCHADESSDPFENEPALVPARHVKQRHNPISYSSKRRHHMGRYQEPKQRYTGPQRTTHRASGDANWTAYGGSRIDYSLNQLQHETAPEPADDASSESSVIIHPIDLHLRPIESPFRNHPFNRILPEFAAYDLPNLPSYTSIQSVDLQDVLLPADDPLLDTPPSPTDSSNSWESIASETVRLGSRMHDDDTDTSFQSSSDRCVDSGWGGECLHDTEDIDFEFVYALHTFVATVEGQANAQKGDTMVLLDDSNSYWWLVRVVKDSSIGYLPAEHIETPTERLARLNKHRNIDLSATMLSDNSEKTRNPLKKAMRRRNAKTVQFAAPTYVEASDYDYSSDEEGQPPTEPYATAEPSDDAQQTEHTEEEPVAEKALTAEEPQLSRASSSSSRASFDREQAATAAALLNGSSDEPQLSPKLMDKTEAAPLKSRRTRNTDSFLKDDTIETRKITLTPGLLREEGKNSTSVDSVRNPSLENLVKQISPPDSLNKKDSKKEKKEKKPGMLSGLFKSKKKDKKTKDDVVATDLSDVEKVSYEAQSPTAGSPSQSGRGSPSVANTDAASLLSPLDTRRQEVQTRQPTRGKLQKQPPLQQNQNPSPSPSCEIPAQEEAQPEQVQNVQQAQVQPKDDIAELEGSEAAVEIGAAEPEQAAADDQAHLHTELALQEKQQSGGVLSPLTNMLSRDGSKSQKPVKAKKVKERMELDDFDSPSDDEGPNPFKEQEERAAAPADSTGDDERLSDSPVEITHSAFMHGTDSIHIPLPGPDELRGLDDDDVDDVDEEEPESLPSSPSLIEADQEEEHEQPHGAHTPSDDPDPTPTAPRSPAATSPFNQQQQPQQPQGEPTSISPPQRGLSTDSSTTSTTSSSAHLSPSSSVSVSQQPWSDASLRAWLEDGSEVKDMMVMIYDKSGVVPVGEDHPLMEGLFTEQRKGVQGMMGELDGLLGNYLQRRGIALS